MLKLVLRIERNNNKWTFSIKQTKKINASGNIQVFKRKKFYMYFNFNFYYYKLLKNTSLIATDLKNKSIE